MDEPSRVKQSDEIRQRIKSTMVQTTAVQVGALGLGAMFTVAAFDWTGIAGAGALAAAGFSILPYRRRQLKAEMRQLTTELRKELKRVVNMYVSEEVDASRQRIENALRPYSRFVEAERKTLGAQSHNLGLLRNDMLGLERLIKNSVTVATASAGDKQDQKEDTKNDAKANTTTSAA
eukprot:TRINITY_DN116896_c0_g1_i1.p3 TRINITY_DN116896_c0_g1~~TRINITY_DN116896_c0_g1_i1.p3  ORF type:complete len:177 (-),score=78.02 TRINITY_DN116896_c0_g1_i1:20-550(-)